MLTQRAVTDTWSRLTFTRVAMAVPQLGETKYRFKLELHFGHFQDLIITAASGTILYIGCELFIERECLYKMVEGKRNNR